MDDSQLDRELISELASDIINKSITDFNNKMQENPHSPTPLESKHETPQFPISPDKQQPNNENIDLLGLNLNNNNNVKLQQEQINSRQGQTNSESLSESIASIIAK